MEKKQYNLWICKQKLQSHLESILSLIISNNDDLIISGSKDKTIKIWDKYSQNKIVAILQGKREWWCKQTLTSHIDFVFSVALNEQSNQFNLLWKRQQNNSIQRIRNRLDLQQIIHVQCSGLGICFINDHIFCFQPQYQNKIDIYMLEYSNYVKTKEISFKIGGASNNLFRQQMIKSKQLVILLREDARLEKLKKQNNLKY